MCDTNALSAKIWMAVIGYCLLGPLLLLGHLRSCGILAFWDSISFFAWIFWQLRITGSFITLYLSSVKVSSSVLHFCLQLIAYVSAKSQCQYQRSLPLQVQSMVITMIVVCLWPIPSFVCSIFTMCYQFKWISKPYQVVGLSWSRFCLQNLAMLTDITVHFRCPINSVWMAAMNRGTIKSQGEKCNVPHLSKRPDSKSPLSRMVNMHQPDQEKKLRSAASEVHFHATYRQVYICLPNMVHPTDDFLPIMQACRLPVLL